jgi:hypothetical protein
LGAERRSAAFCTTLGGERNGGYMEIVRVLTGKPSHILTNQDIWRHYFKIMTAGTFARR